MPGLDNDSTVELASLSSEQLERLTVRAYRFWSNWTSLEPKCHARLDIQPTSRPWAQAGSRNLAAEFLPGWGGRYLLTLTLFDSSSDRENRRFSFECWDLRAAESADGTIRKPIAELLVAGLLGYAVNTALGNEHVLAVTRRNGNQSVRFVVGAMYITDEHDVLSTGW